MRSTLSLLILLAWFAPVGCTAPQPHPEQHAEINVAMIELLNRSAIDNAIVRQHTIFPYHFVEHGAALNDLGRRDLAVLSAHFRTHPGPLNIRRGHESDEVYERRIATVLAEFDRAGIPAEAVEWTDGPVGGDGVRAERAVRVLVRDRTRATQPTTGTGVTR